MSSQQKSKRTFQWKKKREYARDGDDIMKDSKPTDIVIPVMGPSGVGKSSFINVLACKDVAKVGHDLNSCTAKISHVVLDGIPGYPALQNRRLIIVDTPGFDDTYVDDAEILRRISVWLAKSYNDKMTLGGVIYLHDISQTRMQGTTRRTLELFLKLCGTDALGSVIVGTTKWEDTDIRMGEIREKQLCDLFWKPMIAAGSSVHRYMNTSESAWDLVNTILDKVVRHDVPDALQIQKEIVDLSKILPDTEVGQELRFTLEQLLENQKLQGNEEQIQKTIKAINDLKVTIPKRILMFFGMEMVQAQKEMVKYTNTNLKHKNIHFSSVTTSTVHTVDKVSSVIMSDNDNASVNYNHTCIRASHVTFPGGADPDTVKRITAEGAVVNTNLGDGPALSDTKYATLASTVDKLSVRKENTVAPMDITRQSPVHCIVDGEISSAKSAQQNTDVFECTCIVETTAPDVSQVNFPQYPDYRSAPVDSGNRTAKSTPRNTAVAIEHNCSVEARTTKTARMKTTLEKISSGNGCSTANNHTANWQVTAGVTTAIERTSSVESHITEVASVKATLQKEGCDNASATNIQSATQIKKDDDLQESHRLVATTTLAKSTTDRGYFKGSHDIEFSNPVMSDSDNTIIHSTHTDNRTTTTHINKSQTHNISVNINGPIYLSAGPGRRQIHVTGSKKKKSHRVKRVR